VDVNITPRPDYVTDEILEYLDTLRAEGTVNMFGAGMYLRRLFDLSEEQSRSALIFWIQKFTTR